MFLILAIIFAVSWVLDIAFVHASSAAGSMLLVSAVVCGVAHLVRGRNKPLGSR